MNELNILKEEMAALKRDLDKEQIVNEKLMHTVMKQKVSWLNTFVIIEFISLPFIYLIFAVACAMFGLSQWYAVSFLILGILDAVTDLRTFRISPKLFSTSSMMEVRKQLKKQKKERFIHTCVALPLAIIWIILFSMAILNGNDNPVGYAGLAGGIIGAVIGGVVVYILYNKAQKTNDDLIDMENEEMEGE